MAKLAIVDKSIENPQAFRGRITSQAKLDGETEASYAVSSVAQVLRRHVPQGELDDVRTILPDGLRVILS